MTEIQISSEINVINHITVVKKDEISPPGTPSVCMALSHLPGWMGRCQTDT